MKLTCFFLSTVFLAAQSANGVILAQYLFDNDATHLDADVLATGVTESGPTSPDFALTVTVESNLFAAEGQGVEDGTADDMEAAWSSGQYVEFTITAAAGGALSLDSLTFENSRAIRGTNDFAIRTSVDGFAENLVYRNQGTTEILTLQTVNFNDPSDLSGLSGTDGVVGTFTAAQFDGLPEITIRIAYDDRENNSGGASATRLDNWTLNGSVGALSDNDSDNLSDFWEIATAGNLTDLTGLLSGPGPGAGTGDFDGDSLSDLEEFDLAVTNSTYPSLDPTEFDSDGDTLSDGAEVNGSPATDPTDIDTDDDGLDDDKELAGQNQTGVSTGFGASNPTSVDSDMDGVPDLVEIDFSPASNPNVQDDTDGDGIPNILEDLNLNGVADPGETDALNVDTDGDTLGDGIEDANQNGITDVGETDPLFADTDGDGLDDNVDGAPLDPDQDDDGVLDGDDTAPNDPTNDSDGDGIGNSDELAGNDAGGAPHSFGPTDPNLIDTDGDGIDDDKEIAGQDQSGVATGFGATNPNDVDTDTDGFGDGEELVYGGDPTVFESSLPSAVLGYTATGGDWLTAFGANDIDGDGALGTDGFIFYGLFAGGQMNGQPYGTDVESSPLPSYVASHGAGADFLSVAYNFPTYGQIDNPLTLDGSDQTGGVAVGNNGSQGSVLELVTFEIDGLAAGQEVRVGILGGVEGNVGGVWDPTQIILTGPNDYLAAGLNLEINPGGGNAGWLFFDITEDGVYTVSGTRRATNGGAGIGGLTFDSIGGPVVSDLNLCIENAANGSDLVFEWENATGATYDILSATDLNSPPSTWAVWQTNIAADASGTNSETFARPSDLKSFFVIVEK